MRDKRFQNDPRYSSVQGEFLAKSKERINILHIEDNPADVVLFKHYLTRNDKDYEVTNTAKVVDAFNLLEKQTYDIIVLDLNLLDMDGLACVSALNTKAPHTPLLVYSGNLDESVRNTALLCGARRFIPKGHCNSESLKSAIHEILEDN